jgi:hypothetical protein
MDRRSTRSTMVLFAGALAFAAWGCGGDGANFPTGDGGSLQHDAQKDGEAPDGAKHDAHHDGGEGDAGDGPLTHAPVITFLAPTEGQSEKGTLEYAFTITDEVDGLKAVAPEVSLDGVVLTTTWPAPTAGDTTYEATGGSLDITAQPDGPHTLAVRAWDVGDTVGVASVSFLVDRAGPVFANPKPSEGEFVAGTIALSVTITDNAGVDDSSVSVEIRESGHAATIALYRLPGTDEFVGSYPTNMLWNDMIWPQLLWRATDLLGNESLLAYQVAVDDTPPRITLVSPNVYLSKVVEGEIQCARPFDPLANSQWGMDVYDGARVPQEIFLRARIEDSGNFPTGTEIMPVSGVDESTVRLYVRPLDSTPLVKASSGVCTEINPDLHEVAALSGSDPTEVLVVDLVPIPPGGNPDFRPYLTDPVAAALNCQLLGDDTVVDPPLPKCARLSPDSQAFYSIGQPYDWTQAATFGVAPVVEDDGLKCEGIQFDARQLPDGWMCVTVAARDNLGNLGVAKPLRLCLDKQLSNPSVCQTLPTQGCSDQACDILEPFGAARRRIDL